MLGKAFRRSFVSRTLVARMSDTQSYEPVYGHLATKAVQSGESGGRVSMQDCVTTPIAQTSAYTFKNTQQLIDFCEQRFVSFEYGRYGNPTTRALEDKLKFIEGGEDALFSASGMNSNSSTMLAMLPPGGKLMTLEGCYRQTESFAKEFAAEKLGVQLSHLNHDMGTKGMVEAILAEQPDVVFAECPSSVFLRVMDLKAISAACKEAGSIFIVDATYATPMNQRTLDLGADLVIHSASKYISGHNDVMGGVVIGKAEMVQKVRTLHAVLGGVMDPHAAYLVMRGVKTMGIRVEHQNNSALELANYLSSVPQIKEVFYPGLRSHPDYDIAKKQMSGGGGVVSFVIRGGKENARKFLDALRIPYIGSSLGGVESLVELPSIAYGVSDERLAEMGIPVGLVRFSCGLEDTVDLLTDVAQALKEANA